jgi:hypothetical protein
VTSLRVKGESTVYGGQVRIVEADFFFIGGTWAEPPFLAERAKARQYFF